MWRSIFLVVITSLALTTVTSLTASGQPSDKPLPFDVVLNSSDIGAGSLLFSRDGKQIISASNAGIQVWDATTGLLVRQMVANVSSMTLSRDGRTLITGSQNRAISFWDLLSGRMIRSYKVTRGNNLQEVDEEIKPLSLSSDGRKLFAGKYNFFDVWDLQSGRVERSIKFDPGAHKYNNASLDLLRRLPDGRRFVTYAYGSMKIWDGETGRLLSTARKNKEVDASDLSPDGRYLAIASFNRGIELIDIASDRVVKILKAEFPPMTGIHLLSYSPNGRQLVSIARGEYSVTAGGAYVLSQSGCLACGPGGRCVHAGAGRNDLRTTFGGTMGVATSFSEAITGTKHHAPDIQGASRRRSAAPF